MRNICAAEDARVASLFTFALHLLKNGPPENGDEDDEEEEEEEEDEEEEETGDGEEAEEEDADNDHEQEEEEGNEGEEEERDQGNYEGNSHEHGEEENQEDDPILEVMETEPSKVAEPKVSMNRLRSKSSIFSDLHSPDRQYIHPDEKKMWVPESDCVIVSESSSLSEKAAQRERLASLMKQINEQKPTDSKLCNMHRHGHVQVCMYIHDAVDFSLGSWTSPKLQACSDGLH